MRRFNAAAWRLIDEQKARDDQRVSSAAILLALVGTGLDIDPHTIIEDLAQVADLHNLDPDTIQALLETHEPSLGAV